MVTILSNVSSCAVSGLQSETARMSQKCQKRSFQPEGVNCGAGSGVQDLPAMSIADKRKPGTRYPRARASHSAVEDVNVPA
jgi:hypothetical protein